MDRIEHLQKLAGLFCFEIATDSAKNEYVLLRHSCCGCLPDNISDKTLFESSCNHVHLLDCIREEERADLQPVARQIAQTLLKALKHNYPHKHFKVFATISDSFIVRFHQDWPGEFPYCNTEEFASSREFVYMAEG